MSVPYQDLEVRVLVKSAKQLRKESKKKKNHDSVLKKNAGKNKQSQPDHTNFDNEDCAPPAKVSHSLKMQIQRARNDKKMSQKDLATRCNLPLNTIKSYENGTAVPNNQHLNKMRSVLGVRLKK